MAALNANQVVKLFDDGRCSHTALYSMKNVTAGDTYDLIADFAVVKRAGIVSDTAGTIGGCGITGTPPTIITIPAGPSNDGVWLLVVGVVAAS